MAFPSSLWTYYLSCYSRLRESRGGRVGLPPFLSAWGRGWPAFALAGTLLGLLWLGSARERPAIQATTASARLPGSGSTPGTGNPPAPNSRTGSGAAPGPGGTGQPGAADPAPPELQGSVRILAYNIRHGAGEDDLVDLDRTAATIAALAPDVAFLTEVDVNWRRSGYVDQVEELSRRLAMPYHYFAPALEVPHWTQPWRGIARYGVALLSRHPIVAASHHRLPGPPGREPRVLLRADLNLGGHPLTLFGTHLGLSEAERDQQVVAILRHTLDAPAHRILLGDLNAVPGAPEIRRLTAPLAEFEPPLWLDASPRGAETEPSFPAGRPRSRIDYALVSPELKPSVLDYVTVPSLASDHRPILVTLAWPPVAGEKAAGSTAAAARPVNPGPAPR